MSVKEPYEQGIEPNSCICGHSRAEHHIGTGPCTKPPFGKCNCWKYQRATWWRKLARKVGLT